MMTLRCPVCRAENAERSLCRRCKADLSLLWDLEDQRALALRTAHEAAAAGSWSMLLTSARRADSLRGDGETRQLLAVAHLLAGDYLRALRAARA